MEPALGRKHADGAKKNAEEAAAMEEEDVTAADGTIDEPVAIANV